METILHTPIKDYSITDIIKYRALPWSVSEEVLCLTEVPEKFEPYFVETNYYCFGMITSGRLDIAINDEREVLTRDSLLVYRPGQFFKVHQLEKNSKGFFILFSRKFLDNLDENIFSVKAHSFLSQSVNSFITLSHEDSKLLLNTFKTIFSMLKSVNKPDWELIARNLLSALLYETNASLKKYVDTIPEKSFEHHVLLERFMKLVRLHFQQERKIIFYSEMLSITSGHLQTAIKKISGKNPSTIIAQQVIKEAKALMAETTFSISEIAYKLSFSDPFTFSKFFKKHSGITPTLFRSQMA